MIEIGVQPFESGGELARALLKSIADAMNGKGTKSKHSLEVFENIVVRSLIKTGSTLRKLAYTSFRKNEIGLEPLRRHPANQANIKMTIMAERRRKRQSKTPKLDMREGYLGGRFPQMMRFRVDESDRNVVVGLVESTGRGAIGGSALKEWQEKFKKWQEGGQVEYWQYPRGSLSSMYTYFAALGIPITRPPVRPKREVMTVIEAKHKPADLFKQFLEERIQR